jgi:hypothetical protein
MKTGEGPMTETESLQLITSMINKAQNRYSERGTLYLFWGWLIFFCCLVQFVALYFFKMLNAHYIWYLTWLGIVYQFVFIRRRKKEEKAKTYTEDFIGYVWLVFLICIFLLVFMQIYLDSGVTICPSILIIYGMPTMLTGAILRSRALKAGGIFCWILAVISVFLNYEFQLLLIALAVAGAWIIPGYTLRQKFKKTNMVLNK